MTRSWIIGVDEAGYGPTLGPLVVAGIRAESGQVDALCATTGPKIGDSKKIYGRGGLPALERAALAALSFARGELPQNLSAALGGSLKGLRSHPWYGSTRLRLPVANAVGQIEADVAAWERVLGSTKDRGLGVEVGVALESVFNAACTRLENKAAFELELIGSLLRRGLVRDGEGQLCCDRLGGRRYYADVLGQWFPKAGVMVSEESREEASYRVFRSAGDFRASFVVKGEERHAEIALASIVAKYLRELFMRQFNAYWKARVPGLMPTAGYPQDARRFIEALEDAGIDPATRSRLCRAR